MSMPAHEHSAEDVSHSFELLFLPCLLQCFLVQEYCVTYQILRLVSPLEAELIRDPSMQCKIRFRFAGEEFPPFIVFKIFHHTGGYGNKYINGKRALNPSSEAAADACRLMGYRVYYDQMIRDEVQHLKHKITDIIDVATMKDYMQYISHLDETPAYLGGRDNHWRKLSLENVPRTMIMYDIINYAESGKLSSQLKKELSFLLCLPHNEEVQRRQLSIVTQSRQPVALSTVVSRSAPVSAASSCSIRRSHRALKKVAKMKRTYGLCRETEQQEQKTAYFTSQNHLTEDNRKFTSPTEDMKDKAFLSDEEWEKEAEKLYAWSQELTLEETEVFSP
uniref:Uncharacterized protein n=1 Tax=Geotrypetes seraphini TaxID=260995 RepID=A0A6P8RKE6_GEOSA|nr:putative uncharacterized protein CXorf58 homolog isoform X3 [Geotrypetes seraphini]XP_033805150.1 putative uncharacterized protein CXorf58 homolog isoform X3 [Geotrypetes seraphini]XP_033805151.1 putative uncharacterized protein CXorf58 homolog isoform X3 [Geotrypetes seraphini]XP_033805152.1 putative uncharacterized protein CXorf58 homolog isoform X3 [Geotrypetes seraphini]